MRLTPTGSIQNWLMFCRILDKMNKDPDYSDRLGLKDLSVFTGCSGKPGSGNETINEPIISKAAKNQKHEIRRQVK